MSTTTVFGQVDTDQPSTHNKRNAAIVFTVIALFALSFFLGRATAPNHLGSSAQTHAQLSAADRAIVANDVAPITPTYVEVAPNREQLSPANRALIANDVAPLSNTSLAKLSPTNRGQIMNDDLAPVTPLSQANTTSCIAGRPC